MPSVMASVNASSICESRADRSEDAQVRNQAAPRADQRHHLLRGEIAGLVQRAVFDRQFVALAE